MGTIERAFVIAREHRATGRLAAVEVMMSSDVDAPEGVSVTLWDLTDGDIPEGAEVSETPAHVHCRWRAEGIDHHGVLVGGHHADR